MHQPPNCPQDGSPMVLRTAKKGRYAGTQFWGCSKYPKCKEILPFDATSSQANPHNLKSTDRPVSNQEELHLSSVNWSEQKNRPNWIREYVVWFIDRDFQYIFCQLKRQTTYCFVEGDYT